MKHRLIVAAITLLLTASAQPGDEVFDYSTVKRIDLSDSSGAFAYAEFYEFRRLKQIIESAMKDAKPGEAPSPALFTARLKNGKDEQTVYIGDAWVSDGEKIAELGESELEWIMESMASRSLEQ